MRRRINTIVVIILFLASGGLANPAFGGKYEADIQGTDNLCIVRYKKDRYREALDRSQCKKGDWLVVRGGRSAEPQYVGMFVAESCVMETVIYYQYAMHPTIVHCVYRGSPRNLSGTETELDM